MCNKCHRWNVVKRNAIQTKTHCSHPFSYNDITLRDHAWTATQSCPATFLLLSFPPKLFLQSVYPISSLILGHHVHICQSARMLYNVHICSHLKWCFDSLPPRVPASGAWQVQADYVRLCQSPFACDVVTCLRRASSGLARAAPLLHRREHSPWTNQKSFCPHKDRGQ